VIGEAKQGREGLKSKDTVCVLSNASCIALALFHSDSSMKGCDCITEVRKASCADVRVSICACVCVCVCVCVVAKDPAHASLCACALHQTESCQYHALNAPRSAYWPLLCCTRLAWPINVLAEPVWVPQTCWRGFIGKTARDCMHWCIRAKTVPETLMHELASRQHVAYKRQACMHTHLSGA
jgi:hypothetical protein